MDWDNPASPRLPYPTSGLSHSISAQRTPNTHPALSRRFEHQISLFWLLSVADRSKSKIESLIIFSWNSSSDLSILEHGSLSHLSISSHEWCIFVTHCSLTPCIHYHFFDSVLQIHPYFHISILSFPIIPPSFLTWTIALVSLMVSLPFFLPPLQFFSTL